MTTPFTYPKPAARRHAPKGYANYASYRSWLRDEFAYRCAFCLLREQWGRVRGTFALDHFLPVSLEPYLAVVYENLIYSCVGCNGAKSNRIVPDPLQHLTAPDVWVTEDGRIRAKSAEGQILIEGLGLDSEDMRNFRLLWIGIVSLARHHDPALYQTLMGYPDELPDLSKLKPPDGNDRPQGLVESAFSRRESGELPEIYY